MDRFIEYIVDYYDNPHHDLKSSMDRFIVESNAEELRRYSI